MDQKNSFIDYTDKARDLLFHQEFSRHNTFKLTLLFAEIASKQSAKNPGRTLLEDVLAECKNTHPCHFEDPSAHIEHLCANVMDRLSVLAEIEPKKFIARAIATTGARPASNLEARAAHFWKHMNNLDGGSDQGTAAFLKISDAFEAAAAATEGTLFQQVASDDFFSRTAALKDISDRTDVYQSAAVEETLYGNPKSALCLRTISEWEQTLRGEKDSVQSLILATYVAEIVPEGTPMHTTATALMKDLYLHSQHKRGKVENQPTKPAPR